jgi:hypothetical protein
MPQCVVARISASNSKGCSATRLINAFLQQKNLAFPGFQFDSPVIIVISPIPIRPVQI